MDKPVGSFNLRRRRQSCALDMTDPICNSCGSLIADFKCIIISLSFCIHFPRGDVSSSSSDVPVINTDAAGATDFPSIYFLQLFASTTSEIQFFQANQLVADKRSMEMDVGFPIVTYEVDGLAM